jgi:hypothetical protein
MNLRFWTALKLAWPSVDVTDAGMKNQIGLIIISYRHCLFF